MATENNELEVGSICKKEDIPFYFYGGLPWKPRVYLTGASSLKIVYYYIIIIVRVTQRKWARIGHAFLRRCERSFVLDIIGEKTTGEA